jgi:hypothetical protein
MSEHRGVFNLRYAQLEQYQATEKPLFMSMCGKYLYSQTNDKYAFIYDGDEEGAVAVWQEMDAWHVTKQRPYSVEEAKKRTYHFTDRWVFDEVIDG